jgi:Lar family restriction alleviation protein
MTTKTTNWLKHCPFCGFNHEDTHVQLYSDKEPIERYMVICGACCASGPLEPTEEKAAGGWNGRYQN